MQSPEPPSDTSLSLLQRACADDQVAWSRIWELYWPLIYAQCRSSSIQAADMEDIAQNVLISVQRRLGDFRKTEQNHTFRGWLHTITRNEISNFFRSRNKGPTAQGGSENRMLIDQHPDEPPADSSGNQFGIDPVLQRALEMLRGEFDERNWGIFWRFKIDNVPARQVAEEFGTTDGNVRIVALRVLRRLQTDFDGLVDLPE